MSAPIDVVWPFMIDPGQVVTCMPGTSLDEQLDDFNFVGSMKIKLGAVKTQYKCKVKLTAVDDQTHSVRLLANGREAGGGTMKGTLTSTLLARPDGGTEVVCDAKLELTGRVAQLGQGMIESVARRLFRQFAEKLRERLESDPTSAPQGAVAADPPAPIRLLPTVLATLRATIASWVRRLLGGNRE